MVNKPEAYEGYISKSARQKFTITAGVLGAVFLMFQFIYPFIHMFFFMPGLAGNYKMTSYSVNDVSIHKDRLFYLSRTISIPGDDVEDTDAGKAMLYSTELYNKSKSVLEAELEEEEIYPVSNGDSLWLVTPFNLYELTSSGIQSRELNPVLSNIESVFLFNNAPAVIEDHPSGLMLKPLTHQEEAYKPDFLFVDFHFFYKLQNLPSNSDEERVGLIQNYRQEKPFVIREIKAIEINEELNFFLKIGNNLYYARSNPHLSGPNLFPAQKILESVDRYFVIEQNGIPVVYYTDDLESGSSMTLKGVKVYRDYKVLKFDEISRPMMVENYRIIKQPGSDSPLLVHQTMPFNIMVSSVVSGEPEKIRKIGRGMFSFFGGGSMILMFMPQLLMLFLPILLAIILSVLMSRMKITRFESNGNSVQYASLIQRALAQLVDALFLSAPIITGYILIFSTVFNLGKFPLAGVLSIMFGFVWVVIGGLLLSYWEGRSGRTPGKRIMKIKVIGTDFKPIGFGRGILRNILKIVDGFFNFMVGIMIIALNKNWQRIGDLVSDSIVIKANSLISEEPEEKA